MTVFTPGRLAPLPFLLLLATACDYDARQRLQYWDPESGSYIDSDVVNLDALGACDGGDNEDCRPELDGGPVIGHLGITNLGGSDGGGATVTFDGTGGPVCVIVDPQTVWRDDYQLNGNSMSRNPTMEQYVWDDGDIDMMAGLSAHYTGTAGVEMGTFETPYVDALGVERRGDLNICVQLDRNGIAGGTAGSATPEWCQFQTEEGVNYTVALHTFSVPLDDGDLRYVFEISSGNCPAIVNECTLRGDAEPHETVDGVVNLEDEHCAG